MDPIPYLSRATPMYRLILFGDARSLVTTLLTDATLRQARNRKDFRVAAFCDVGRGIQGVPLFAAIPMALVGAAARRLLNGKADPGLTPRQRLLLRKPCRSDALRLARLYRIPVLRPPDGNINHADFVAQMRRLYSPDFAIAYGCPNVFRKDLLGSFRRTVNYHDGLLPSYAGLGATSWSMFRGESASGFTFHLMDEHIDTGNILVQNSVPIGEHVGYLDLAAQKTIKAAACVGKVLEKLAAGDRGRPQEGVRTYFGLREGVRITTVEDPRRCTFEELLRRLRAFRMLLVHIGGEVYPVTDIARADSRRMGRDALCFRTLDAALVRARRLLSMPPFLYRVYKVARRWEAPTGRG